MNLKLFLVGCIIATLAVQIAAACLCGAEGDDVCSCTQTRIPRPQQLHLRSTPSCNCDSSQNRHGFRPVGDRCSCGNSAVVPAIRPPCRCQKGKTSSSSPAISTPSDCGQTIHAPFEANVFTTNHIKKEDVSSSIPIDPVSMSLAYKSAQEASIMIPEEKLAFGFRKVPANAENVKHVPNIPEEKLYSFRNKVVELKQIACNKQKGEESEEQEEEVEEEEEDKTSGCSLAYLNYHQMGYHPQVYVDPEFASQIEIEAEEEKVPCSQEPIKELGSCGYKPGKIVGNAHNLYNYDGPSS